jgi:cation transport ATPase
MLQHLVGVRDALAFPGDAWVGFAFASAVYVCGGWPFLRGLVEELRKRLPGMMTLVALAISVAYVGTDVAVESADIVLVRSDPRDVAAIVELARATCRKMVQNLWWATAYNAVALPLAAGVLAGAGILLSPALGAVLMSVSTVVVAINARLLGRRG